MSRRASGGAGSTLFDRLLEEHLATGDHAGRADPDEVGLMIDQTLMQDTTGSTVMLAAEALGLERACTQVSVQYVDHQIVIDPDADPERDLVVQSHRWLESASRRFGLWYSRPGNGISHLVHLERFGIPGRTLLGADSHSCAAGAIGMLAIGAGGLDVALALAGWPYYLIRPRVRRIRLVGELGPGVTAKDVGFELLRRYGVSGGIGEVFEYSGPGLGRLDVMDRFVIAGMGAEAGATTSVFPSDEATHVFLERHGRGGDWVPLAAGQHATYDADDEIDLADLEPLIAMPSSPGNVVTVAEVAGTPIVQSYLGSAGNPGYVDFASAAVLLAGRQVAAGVRLDVNLPSARIERALAADGLVAAFEQAGATLHPTGCDEYTRATQAPPPGELSLRSVNRNFPGRSGTADDRIALASPLTVAASAVTGVVTDPRGFVATIEIPTDPGGEPPPLLDTPQPREIAARTALDKGPNIVSLPRFDPLPDAFCAPVLLVVGDDVSTDEIVPAGPDVQPFRTNLPRLSRFVFRDVDRTYVERAVAQAGGGHVIVGGRNYGQGSSREHAALAPRALGLMVVLAVGFARIHLRNLANAGVLPLVFAEAADRDRIRVGDELAFCGLGRLGADRRAVDVHNVTRDERYPTSHPLSARELRYVGGGGALATVRQLRVVDQTMRS